MQEKKARIPDSVVAVLVTLVAAGLAGCNGAASSPTSPDAASGETGRVLILSQTFDGVSAGDERVVDFSLARAGTLAVSIGWTNADNSVAAVLTSVTCPYFRRAPDDCPIRGSVGEERGKDGRGSTIQYRETAGAYRLSLRNLGPGTESISVTAELDFAAEPPAPTPEPSASPQPQRPERPERPERDPRQ